MKRPPISVLLAIAGVIVAGYYLQQSALKLPSQQPLRPPTQNPYQNGIAGVGLVESKEKNRRIDPYFTGHVAHVFVIDGQPVGKGDPLYQLDTQQIEAQLNTQQASIQASQATLIRLSHLPRAEDIVPAEAQVRATKAKLASLQANLQRLEVLAPTQSVSQDQIATQRFAVQEAQAQADQAQGALARIKAGSWRFELDESKAQLGIARQQINQLQVQLAQATVRSPLAGTVLQVNIRTGQTVSPSDPVPPVLVGRTHPLQIRVDVDEVSASRLSVGSLAKLAVVASLKGNATQKFPLRFVRIEPYMVPKKTLTGDSIERTDVRVLQLIYDALVPPGFPLYVGQQVDVFIRQPATTSGPLPGSSSGGGDLAHPVLAPKSAATI
jgi:HlyD family secretion protein